MNGECSTRPQPNTKGPPKKRGRPRKTQLKEIEKAHLEFNPEGFFEVRVDQQHCANIAEACGLRIEQINDLLRDDNFSRSTLPIQQELLNLEDSDQGEHISDFDPLTEDELSSCSE